MMQAREHNESLKWAEYYLSLGWHLTFFSPGTKGPSGPSSVGWNTPRELVTTPERAAQKLANGPMNMGLCHLPSGTISLDVDDEAWTRVIFEEFGIDYDELLSSGMRIKSKAGRDKAIFCAPHDLDLHKVSWPKPDAAKPTERFVIFELRSGPNQDVLPPSLHPDGHNYEWAEGNAPWDFQQLPTIPDALLHLWRNFAEIKEQIDSICPWKKKDAPPKLKSRDGVSGENQNIIGKFNAQADVFELLAAGGYKKKGKRWLCPSSSTKIPGVVVFDDGKVFSHHGSDVLADGYAHDAFDLFVQFEHAGNFNEALTAAGKIVGIERGAERFSPDTSIDIQALIKSAAKEAAAATAKAASSSPKASPAPDPVKAEDYTPVPEYLLNPGGVVGDAIEWMLSTAQQPRRILSLVGALSYASTVLGRKVCTETGIRTNLQIVGVGSTSVGKDHARKCCKALLIASGMEDFIGGDEIASGPALLARMSEHPNTQFQPDEFGLLLQSVTSNKAGAHKVEIMTSLMKMFSSAGSVFHGTEYADRRMRERKDIDYPCVNVHATTTAETLWPALNSTHSTSGFINRLIFMFEPTVRIKRRHTGIGNPPEGIVAWSKAVRAASIGMEGLSPANPIVVPMSERAHEVFDSFDDWIADRMDSVRSHGIDSLWGRAWEHAAKVALVVSCAKQTAFEWSDNKRPEISYATACWAIDFVKFALNEMEKEILARVSDSEFGSFVNSVTIYINKAGPKGMTERELAKSCKPFRGLNPQQRDQVLAAVKRNGDAVFVNMGKGMSGRGRDREAWVSSALIDDFE